MLFLLARELFGKDKTMAKIIICFAFERCPKQWNCTKTSRGKEASENGNIKQN